jgi:phosphonate transport system permease protein
VTTSATATETGRARPRKPPLSWKVPAGIGLFLLVTWWAGSQRFGLGFSVPELIAGLDRGQRILDDLLDPRWGAWRVLLGPFVETLRIAILAALLGCSAALGMSLVASRVSTASIGSFIAGKGVLNVVRSVPDLLYAMIFVAVFSIGPLAGIVALILFNIGVVGKLTSETIDGIDTGPLEAAHAAGASHGQAVRTAVIPTVLPNYVAYSLYAFELNIRASLVVGFVGAGGIGQLLREALAAFRYDVVALIVVFIFAIVFVVESFSIALRRKLV